MLHNVAVNRSDLVTLLRGWGYLGPDDPSDDELTAAVARYQAWNGLDADGVVGPRTVHQMTSPMRCGLPDMMSDQMCAWPHRLITYTSQLNLPGLSAADADRAFDTATAQIAEVCGLSFKRVANSPANVVAKSGSGPGVNLDGRGGTLAYSYMPCGMSANGSLRQLYDEGEQWSFSMAVAVMTHELCHAVGLPHLSVGALMAPYYNASITKPQAADIAELQKRYGPPVPQQPVNPTATPAVEVFVVVNGQKFTAAGAMRPV